MFFVFSKILSLLIRPLIWALGLMAFSLFSKKRLRKKRSLMAAIAILFFFSNNLIFNTFVNYWELETITADQISAPYDVGILLGGYAASKIQPSADRFNLSERGNRFSNAIELYFKGKIKKILLTGGSGRLLDKDELYEAQGAAKYLEQMGVPNSDIIIESKSRNTRENAKFSKEILDRQLPDGQFLLITSAWHMPRALACFKKAGFEVTPFSVDFMTQEYTIYPNFILIPSSSVLYKWDALIKEWVGYIAYWLAGYI